MVQDQYPGTLAHSDSSARFGLLKSLPHLTLILLGLGLALLFMCVEAVLWLLNPGHVFGDSYPHTFSALFSLLFSTPWLWLVLFIQIALLCWLVQAMAQPLAVLAYLKILSQEQERYRTLNTPLQSWSAPYEVPVVCYQDDPDPTRPRQANSLTIPELITEVMTGPALHFLLLGVAGAGKTLFLHAYLAAATRLRREHVWGRRCKVPILLPLTYYILFLQAFDFSEPTNFSLLDFLTTCDLPTLVPLRPYLRKLFQQGRVLLLCDGLDEVPGAYRPALDQELIGLFRQNRNALLLTCTPHVYDQSPELIQTIGENLVPRAVFKPLEQVQIRNIVERFLSEQDTHAHPKLPTAGQVMTAIGRTRLQALCSTPFYLFALLEVIAHQKHADPMHLDTRGRLLSAFLRSLEQRMQADGALEFLGTLACLACWRGDNATLYMVDEVSMVRQNAQQHEVFLTWMREQRVAFPFAPTFQSKLALRSGVTRNTGDADLAPLASWLDLSSQDVVSFRHPLVASALLAQYFARLLGTGALDPTVIETFPDDLAPWSEALTLWAGLLDQPLLTANALALLATDYPEQQASAILLSFICLGVAQIPPMVEPSVPLESVLPDLVTALEGLLDNPRALLELAVLFMRCAERGSPELYQALFPILAIKNIEKLLILLQPAFVTDLFFQRLLDVIDDVEQEELVKRLVRALSCWGEAVVPRASFLSTSHSHGRLCTAAINILGGAQAHSAVEPLVACLRASEAFIVTRAANALTRLGASIALPRLLQELAVRPSVQGATTLHGTILPIIERFLNENEPTRQLTPKQNEQVMDALMALLATHTDAADLEQVRAILISQGRLAEERESGKIALSMLIQNLAAGNEKMARRMSGTLKEVGSVATPQLLEQLAQQPPEAERVRILEVLAALRDPRALPTLLHLLEDASVIVQQTLVATFASYMPVCIPGLIEALLHHPDELVAARAEHILGELGSVVVEPVVQALTPVIMGRTSLLVHVLEHVHDVRAVPALIKLLESTQSDVVLTLALAQALGQFADARAVPPLLAHLAGTNALLAEGALNALSNLGELACALLLAQLATPNKTPLVTRIERVLLGMQPFPGERLLQAIDEGNVDQARYLSDVFMHRGADAAQSLVENLFHKHQRIRDYTRQVVERMDGRSVVPALLGALNRPEPAWHALLSTYLLKHPREAIPALVDLLDDPARSEAAVAILLRAGAPVVPALIPAMEASNSSVQNYAKTILVTLVQQQPNLLTNAVQLFGRALSPRARGLLQHVLLEDLVEQSLPALLAGLEDADVTRDASDTLVRLAHRSPAYSASVLEQLLLALRIKSRRAGVSLTLIDLGALAVPGVGALITDPDPEVALAAQSVLSQIGTPALAFLWAAQSDGSDPAKREAARGVFRAMPSSVIKDELVTLLTSARQEDMSMALALLLERIHDEALQPGRAGEMLPSLLEYVQSASNERASLRILALLILLGGPTVIEAVVDALYADVQGHTHLISTLLLLGSGVEAALLTILRDPETPVLLQAEVAGILAMRAPQHPDVRQRALSLSEHGLWAGRSSKSVTTVLQPTQLESALRSLGGLLVAGHWDSHELQMLRASSKASSAERELYDILLGWRYNPQITRLEHDLENEREGRRNEVVAHARELLVMKTQMVAVENELDDLKQEYDVAHRAHEQKNQELHDSLLHLNKEKQELQATLRQTAQEKLALEASSKQAVQERTQLLAEAQRWQEYSQQLEREIASLRRPKPNA